MKRKILIVLCIVFSTIQIASSQSHKKGKDTKVVLKTFNDSISYIIGSDVGGNLKKNNIEVNTDLFNIGLENGLKGGDSLISVEKRQQIMTKFQKELAAKQQEKNNAESTKNKLAGKTFLEENKKKPGVVELPSGLQYKVITNGTGPKPKADDEVEVNYEGKFLDGKIFDSSYDRKQSVSFPLTGVIKGWTEGLQLMNTGSTYEFYIPSDLAYGDKGFSEISGGSTLIFKVELISIKAKEQK
ncbi:MAG: FKBP-type peptidyl-prolyl cis-trans isomerase [Bacteroidota bacterium]